MMSETREAPQASLLLGDVMPEIIYICTEKDLIKCLDDVSAKAPTTVGVDTEGTGLDCHINKIRTTQLTADDEISYVIDTWAIPTFAKLFNKFLLKVKKKIAFIFHNFKFDIKFFWAMGIDFSGHSVFDTMLASKVLECGLDNQHSLKAVCLRYLGIELDKTEQVSDWSREVLTPEQIDYAGTDTFVLKPLARVLLAQLKEEDLLEAFRLEMRAVFGFAMMEFYGIVLDVERLERVRPYYEDMYNQAVKDLLTYVPKRKERQNLLGEVVDYGFKPTSSGDILTLLRGFSIPNPLYRKGSKKPEEKDKIIPSTGSKLLAMLPVDKYPVIDSILKLRASGKIITSYLNNLPLLINTKTKRLHTQFNQIISTGRSCLARGTQVTVVGGYKNIEDMQVGDLVYTYTDEGKLTIRKVLNVWNKGVLPTVKVKWQSSGNGQTGELICTPDHLFKTKYRGWVEAQELNRYDKIYHLTRRDHTVHGKNRPRLYGTHSFMKLEQSVIKEEYFDGTSNEHIHHINGITDDNSLDNLCVLSKEEHTRLHTLEAINQGKISYNSLLEWQLQGNKPPVFSGKQHPAYKHISRFSLLRLIASYKGRLSYIPGDFTTYKKKCIEYGLDYVSISQRYTSAGVYISRGLLLKVLDNKTAFCKKYKIDMRKFYKLCEYYGVNTNHTVTSVSQYIPLEVWDIEVEETNNFIANELCVHNSSTNPNLNQLPRVSGKEPLDENGKGLTLRSCFIPAKTYKFCLSDYCLPVGTLVATTRGLVPIELVTEDDMVFQDNTSVKAVQAVITKGTLPVYTITTKMGYVLKATANHRVRVLLDGEYIWQEVQDITENSTIAIAAGRGFSNIHTYERLPELTYTHRNNKLMSVPDVADENLAEFLGYLTGDGSFSTYGVKWVVNEQDKDVFNKLKTYVDSSFGYTSKERQYKGVYETGINSTAVLAWLRLVGSSKDYVPSFVYRSPASVVGAYLRGLFESDGSVCDRITLCTTSEILMTEVQQLLLGLGILSVLKPVKMNHLAKKQAYCLSIPALFTSVFADKIGFISARKKEKLALLCSVTNKSPSYGGIPLPPDKLKSINPRGEVYKLLRNSIVLGRPVSFNTAFKLSVLDREASESLGLLRTTEECVYYDTVESVEYYGEEECFDLTVADRQTYISQGFVSHNSQIELRVMASVCGDENMLAEFRDKKDPYASTAALINDLNYDDIVIKKPGKEDKIKPEHKKIRQNAKPVRLGYAYSMSAKAFKVYAHQTYGVILSDEEAEHNREKYFASYPGLTKYHERFHDKEIREVRTLPPFRRRRLWDTYPGVPALCNMPVQGCLFSTTRVRTSKGYEQIGKLYEKGETITIWTGHTWAKATVLNRGKCQLADLTLQTGKLIHMDTRHEVLVATDECYKFKKVTELTSEDVVCTSLVDSSIKYKEDIDESDRYYTHTPIRDNETGFTIDLLSEEFWYWVGFIAGDGSIRKSLSVFFGYSQHSEELAITQFNRFVQFCESIGLEDKVKIKPNYGRPKQLITASVGSVGLCRFLTELFNNDTNLYTKRVPDSLFTKPLNCKKAFIKGLLDSDGYIKADKRTVNIHLANNNLLQDMYLLCHEVGIPSSITTHVDKHGSVSHKLNLSPEACINHLDLLLSKNKTKSSVCRNVDIPAFVRKAVCNLINTNKLEHITESDRAFKSKLFTGKQVNVYALKDFLVRYNLDLDIPLFDYMHISSFEVLPEEEETFTLSVQHPCHHFDSETLISKNTSGDIQKLAISLIFERLHENGFGPCLDHSIRLVLTIHDELEIEAIEEYADWARDLLEKSMCDAGAFVIKDCPITAGAEIVNSLAEKD